MKPMSTKQTDMKKKEMDQYYKTLRLLFKLSELNSDASEKIDMVTFLDGFNKYWKKYSSKEFNPIFRRRRRRGHYEIVDKRR